MKVLELLDAMIERGISPTFISFRSCIKLLLSKEEKDLAISTLRRVSNTFMPSLIGHVSRVSFGRACIPLASFNIQCP